MRKYSNPETPDEDPLEDLPGDWSEEDRELEHRKPNLGELDDDPDER